MKLLRFIFKYFNYFLSAKNKHDAHSPFLYTFITKVLNVKSNDSNCIKIEALRGSLCKYNNKISIIDYGAGSKINKSKIRTVKDIAKNSAKNSKFGKLLYRIVKFYKPKKILELGTSLGISTLYLAKAQKTSNVITLEGCPETVALAKENFTKLNTNNIQVVLGNFEYTLSNELKKIKKIDLVFVDGNHQEEPTIKYFEKCLQYSHNETIFIFDDIHWSEEMEKAWDHIKSHKKTTLTIDLFYIGIAFIKTELSKENYLIRF